MTFTATEKHDEAMREVEQRKRVYHRLICEGKMSPNTARRQLAVMEAIAADYAEAAQRERLL